VRCVFVIKISDVGGGVLGRRREIGVVNLYGLSSGRVHLYVLSRNSIGRLVIIIVRAPTDIV
jgi:hypothetical protein